MRFPPALPPSLTQEFRLQKLREAGECVAYAEHLRRKDGEKEGEGLLTAALACNFQEAIKGRRSGVFEGGKGRGGVYRGGEK